MINRLKKYLDELKTIKMELVEPSEKPFLTIENYECKLNNGFTVKREKVLKNKNDGSAAIILPITENNKIILAIEPRVFTNNTVDIGFPAGYIEANEDPKASALRELLEETGYEASDIELLGSYYQDQGCMGAYNYYYLATNCKKVKDQNLDEGEFIKYILVTKDELEWLMKNGYIQGLNSAYMVLKMKEYIRK